MTVKAPLRCVAWRLATHPVLVVMAIGAALVLASVALTWWHSAASPIVQTATLDNTDVFGFALDTRTGRIFIGQERDFVIGPTYFNWRSSVLVLDAYTGHPVRTEPLSLQDPFSLIVDEPSDRAVVLSAAATDNALMRASVLDAGTGHLLRTVTTSAGAPTLPILNKRSGTTFTLRDADTLGVFDATGRHLRRLDTGLSVGIVFGDATGGAFAPLPDGRRLTLTNGVLQVHDRRGDRIVRTVAVGGGTGGRIVVDARARRVIVLTGDHWQVQRRDAWRWLPAWLLHALPVHPRPSFSASQPHARVTVLDMARLEKND